MKKVLAVVLAAVWMCTFVAVGSFAAEQKAEKKEGKKMSGEAAFKEHCAVCHPDGGNVVNPKKTLHKKDRDANNVKKVEDIMKLVRNPGPGMTKFDEKTLPDREAKEIAKYILKTFK